MSYHPIATGVSQTAEYTELYKRTGTVIERVPTDSVPDINAWLRARGYRLAGTWVRSIRQVETCAVEEIGSVR